ncbi:MAG: hypothetical protein IPN34_16740 [Planctomycetes bacterium]|nr:hypothetical protein [Planctomycetota bacterium]
MSLPIDSYGASGGAGDVVALVARNRERAIRGDKSWQQSLLSSMRAGSAGVVVFVSGYSPYVPHVGTSPTVFDSRPMVRISRVPCPEAPARSPQAATRQGMLRISAADQALEVLAALSLNKTLLAEVLRVSRPTLYDWLDGKEPNVANAQRLRSLAQLLANAGVTAGDALRRRFVREPLNDGDPSLLDLLKADTLDNARVAKALMEAKTLGSGAERARLAREDRLRALGFEEPTAEQRRETLALNVALREWPQD